MIQSMDSFLNIAKKLFQALSKYACCTCSKQNDDETNDIPVASLRTSSDISKTNNNGVLMRSISPIKISKNFNQSDSSIKTNSSEKIEKNSNIIQNEMDGLKSISTKVGNGFKDLTDSISSKTRNLTKKNHGNSPIKKLTEKLHIRSRQSGAKSADDNSKFERLKHYSNKLTDKVRCNKRSKNGIDTDDKPSFGKKRNKINETSNLGGFYQGSFIETIESESVRY